MCTDASGSAFTAFVQTVMILKTGWAAKNYMYFTTVLLQ